MKVAKQMQKAFTRRRSKCCHDTAQQSSKRAQQVAVACFSMQTVHSNTVAELLELAIVLCKLKPVKGQAYVIELTLPATRCDVEQEV